MLCLTCHQLCRENLPYPPVTCTFRHINKHTHTHCVPFPQSASAEVTRQVAANKALRGQLQEKEDKLCQLQDKLVSHLLSSLVLLPPFCVSYCCLQSSSYFSYFSFFFLYLQTSLSVCLSISPCLHVCTSSAALICSV